MTMYRELAEGFPQSYRPVDHTLIQVGSNPVLPGGPWRSWSSACRDCARKQVRCSPLASRWTLSTIRGGASRRPRRGNSMTPSSRRCARRVARPARVREGAKRVVQQRDPRRQGPTHLAARDGLPMGSPSSASAVNRDRRIGLGHGAKWGGRLVVGQHRCCGVLARHFGHPTAYGAAYQFAGALGLDPQVPQAGRALEGDGGQNDSRLVGHRDPRMGAS